MTYGTWLPGDARGSVTSVRDYRPDDRPSRFRIVHNRVGEPCEAAIAGLHRSAQKLLKAQVVYLGAAEAKCVAAAMLGQAARRGWRLTAVSVMRNHFHAVVGLDGYYDLNRMLASLKSYASAALNERSGASSEARKWWTRGGSTRLLPDERAVVAANNYVLNKQPYPLARWSAADGYLDCDTL